MVAIPPRGPSGRLLAVFFAIATSIVLVACSVAPVRSAFGGRLPMQVSIVSGANDDSPVAVDLVVVYDKKLMDDLLKMPAAQWFAKRQQFKADHDRQIDVSGWEWVPGQSVPPITIPYKAGAKNVVLFADYHSEGDHRAVVGPQEPFKLVLGERDFAVEKAQ